MAALTCAWLALSPAWVAAQPSEPMVRAWTVPAVACGDAASLDAEVARLLGGDPEERRRAVRVHGTVTRGDDGRLSLELRIEDAGGRVLGTRTLSAGACAPLAEAAALLVALTVDPGAVAEGAAEPPALPSTVSVEAATGLDAPRAESARDSDSGIGGRDSESAVGGRDSDSAVGGRDSGIGGRDPESAVGGRDSDSVVGSRRSGSESESESESESGSESESESESESADWPVTFALEGALFLELGVLPAVAAGVSLGARLSRRRLRLGLSAAGLFPREATVARPSGSDASARFYGLAVRLDLGGGFRRGIVLVEGGVVADLAVLSGSSSGVSDPDQGFGAVLLLGGQARVLVRLGRVAVGIEGDLRLPTSRPRFEIRGLGPAHRPSALVGRVGLVMRFPVGS